SHRQTHPADRTATKIPSRLGVGAWYLRRAICSKSLPPRRDGVTDSASCGTLPHSPVTNWALSPGKFASWLVVRDIGMLQFPIKAKASSEADLWAGEVLCRSLGAYICAEPPFKKHWLSARGTD